MLTKLPTYAEYVFANVPRKTLCDTYAEVYSDSLALEEYRDGKISEDQWLMTCAEMDEGDPPDARCFPDIADMLSFLGEGLALHEQSVALHDRIEKSNAASPTMIKAGMLAVVSKVTKVIHNKLIQAYR